MVRTVLHKHTLKNSGCCVIHARIGLPTNNALILSISWPQTHSCHWHWLAMTKLALDSKGFTGTKQIISYSYVPLYYRATLCQHDHPGLANFSFAGGFSFWLKAVWLDIPHWQHRWQQQRGYWWGITFTNFGWGIHQTWKYWIIPNIRKTTGVAITFCHHA